MGKITPNDFELLRIPVSIYASYKEMSHARVQAGKLDFIKNNIIYVTDDGDRAPKHLFARDGDKRVLFKIDKLIGSGASGMVYLYKEQSKNGDGRGEKMREFAVKVVMDPEECMDTSYYLDTDGEISCDLISQKCLNPPGFGKLDLNWNETGPFFIVMDKEEGDLNELLKLNLNQKDNKKMEKIVKSVWVIVKCLVAKGRGYTDLKPANVLYSRKEGNIVVKIGDLDSICELDVGGENVATYPPPDIWNTGFTGYEPTPCTEATMTWLMAIMTCIMFGVIESDSFSWDNVVKYVKNRSTQKVLRLLRDKVSTAIAKKKFGSLPTENLLACLSERPECRPPFDMMFGKKWNKDSTPPQPSHCKPPKSWLSLRPATKPPAINSRAPAINSPAHAMNSPAHALRSPSPAMNSRAPVIMSPPVKQNINRMRSPHGKLEILDNIVVSDFYKGGARKARSKSVKRGSKTKTKKTKKTKKTRTRK